MRLLPILALFVGFVSCEYAWTPGREYEYIYKSRAITAIPGIKEKLSGIGLRSKLIVQVMSENELLVKMTDLAMAEVKNQEAPSEHWRQELPLSYTPLAGEVQNMLARPFKLYLAGGQVEAIQTTAQEPMWVRNLKKAVATQLSVNIAKVNQAPLKSDAHLQENMITQVNKNFYVVEEDSIAGECRTEYTLVPLPQFLAERETTSLPEHMFKMARERPTFILTKTRDYDNCNKKPSFVQMSRPDLTETPCRPTDTTCKKFSSRTSVSRYLLAGIPQDKFEILRVWTEGELIVRPTASNTEAIFTVSNQTLSLENVESIRNPLPKQLDGPKESLTFKSPEVSGKLNPSGVEKSSIFSTEDEFDSVLAEQPEYALREELRQKERQYQAQEEALEQAMEGEYQYKRFNPFSEYREDLESESKFHNKEAVRRNNEDPEYRYRNKEAHMKESDKSSGYGYKNNAYGHKNPSYGYKNPSYGYKNQEEFRSNREQENWRRIPSKYYPSLTRRPAYLHPQSYMEEIPVEKIQSEVKELLVEVERVIESFDKLAEKEPSLIMARVSRLIAMLNYEEIEQIYREVESQSQSSPAGKTVKYLYLDAVAMAGTNPAIVFLKEKIEKKEIRGERAAQLIMTFPVSVKTPTPELLRELTKLAQSVEEERQVWTTTLLAITNILNRACVNPTFRKVNYLYGPYGSPYCTPEEVNVILPYLAEKLESAQKPWKQSALLQAIGNLGDPEIFPVIRSYVLGQKTRDPQIRTKAIFALQHLVARRPNEIFALLKPIFTNPEEHSEIRMAAFAGIVSTKPEKTFFTEAATQTWFEQSQQVASFVYSTFWNLANSTNPMHQNMSQIASIVLPLTKPTKLGAQYSKNIYVTNYLPEEKIGSFLQYAHFGGPKSIIPKDIYAKLVNHVGGFNVPALELALQTQGIQQFLNRIWGPNERASIQSGLNIRLRRDEPVEGSLYVKLFGAIERQISIETLQELFVEGLIEYNGGKNMFINYQKALPLQQNIIVMPIDIGLPVFISIRNPVLVSIRGKVEADIEPGFLHIRKNQYPATVKLHLDVKPFVSMNRIIESGFISPLTRKIYSAGVNTHILVSAPGKVNLHYNKHELEVTVKPTEVGPVPSDVELFHYISRPFVAVQPFFSARKEVSYIYTQPQPTEHRQVIGQRQAGIAVELISKVDQPFNTLAGVYHMLKKHSFLSATQFLTSPQKTLKAVEYKVVLKSAESETKEVKVKLVFSKSEGDYSIQGLKYEQELEKKYYNYPSTHYAASEEYYNKYYSNPLVVMPECQQPDSACYETLQAYNVNVRSSAVRQQLMQSENESETELENEQQWSKEAAAAVNNGKVYSVHAEVALQGQQQRQFRASALVSANAVNTQYKVSLHFEREAAAGLAPYRVCVNGMLKYPLFRSQSRQSLLQVPKTTLGHLDIAFGSTSCHESVIQTRIIMGQTEEMKRRAQDSAEARECAKFEQQGLKYIHVCKQARKQATMLNNYIVDIEGKNLPRQLYNLTHHVDDLVKYMLYPHMSNRRHDVRNPTDRVKIVLTVIPQKSYRPFNALNLFVYKPHENTFFHVIESNKVIDYALPLSTVVSTPRRVLNQILGGQYSATCKLQGNDWITTFDNVTYKYPIKDCFHLVTKDCSKQIPVQVLVKEQGEHKVIRVEISKNIVEIKSADSVTLNGQSIRPQVAEEKIVKEDGRTVLVIKRTPSNEVQVEAPIHGLQVTYEGKYAMVQMSNTFRGRLCGLCGDFNMEKTAEYKTPSECVVSNPEVFGRSWALGSCHKPEQESAECLRQTAGQYNYYGGLEGRPSSSYTSGSDATLSVDREGCTRYIHKVSHRDGETCFSVTPIPECHLKCKRSGELVKKIGFHCIQRGRVAKDMIARAVMGPIEELYEKPVDFHHELSLPESCLTM